MAQRVRRCVARHGPAIAHEKYALPNGLEVILAPDSRVPLVAVNIWYHIGSGGEVPGKTGFAHFFEHLLFEGSENIGRGEFSKYVEKAGGVLNANTNGDRTYYYEVLPSNQFELGLWLESERMLHAKVETKGIETQREVVKEERRQRYENQPYGWVRQLVATALYPEKHPYALLTIGTPKDLDAATLDDVRETHGVHGKYALGCTILIVATIVAFWLIRGGLGG